MQLRVSALSLQTSARRRLCSASCLAGCLLRHGRVGGAGDVGHVLLGRLDALLVDDLELEALDYLFLEGLRLAERLTRAGGSVGEGLVDLLDVRLRARYFRLEVVHLRRDLARGRHRRIA